MSKIGYFAVGWLAGAATVVTVALIVDTLPQPDISFEGTSTLGEIEADNMPEA